LERVVNNISARGYGRLVDLQETTLSWETHVCSTAFGRG